MVPECARVTGLFVGLATLDVIHRVGGPPGVNEKITAEAQFVAAGGPAANAAVAFAGLGGDATLLTVLGEGTIAELIRSDLARHGVRVVDVADGVSDAAPVSSIAVSTSTGERSVIGGDAMGLAAPTLGSGRVKALLSGTGVVLVDGHHPPLARQVSAAARQAAVPTVLDAGRWKAVMPDLFPAVADVVMSSDFHAPGAGSVEETVRAIAAHGGSEVIVATAGDDPVRWWRTPDRATVFGGEVPVPRVAAVDTLGAGDVFHGAYAFARSRGAPIDTRIRFASLVAAERCAHIGPRSWLPAARNRSHQFWAETSTS